MPASVKHRFWMVFTAISTVISLFIFTLSLILTLLLGSPSKAQSIAQEILSSEKARQAIATKLIDQIGQDNDAETQKILKKKRAQFITEIAATLGSKEISSEVKKDLEIGYSYLLGNPTQPTIDVKPFADQLLSALARVDSHFKKNGKDLKDLKPIELKANEKLDPVKKIHNLLTLALWISFLLLTVSTIARFFLGYGYLRVLQTMGIHLLSVGLFPLAIALIAKSVGSSQIEKSAEEVVRTVAPIALNSIASLFSMIAILWMGIGVVLLGSSLAIKFRIKRAAESVAN